MQSTRCFNLQSQRIYTPEILCFKKLSFFYALNRLQASVSRSYSSTSFRRSCQIERPVWHDCVQRFPIIAFWEGVNKPINQAIGVKASDQVINEGEDFERSLFLIREPTVDAKTPKGDLSLAARATIEQFSRLNGLTGKKMRANFESYAPIAVQNEARNLVEFCCFRYLARGNADFHPSLKDAAFRRITFIAMLAWQRPYLEDLNNDSSDNDIKTNFIGEEAFVRIAPSIPGVADRATVHHLFRALSHGGKFISYEVWDKYILELCRILKERERYRQEAGAILKLAPEESIICVASKRQPVQKWNKNIVWPGRLTLTDRGLYYEANGFRNYWEPIKLDLTMVGTQVEKTRVGPFSTQIFDSAISITPNSQSEAWIIEFVDFGRDGRRDVWYAMLQEVICLHNFIREFSPREDDPSLKYIYGAKHGTKKAITSATLGLARLQAVHTTLGKNVCQPDRLLQFYYLSNAPGGDLVLQTLAVSYWGGRMELNPKDPSYSSSGGVGLIETSVGSGPHLTGTDGSIYLRKWMTSPTWHSAKSSAFWKHKAAVRGLVLGKHHVVGSLTQIDAAVLACKEQSNLAEKTKATIDGALLKGIPENIDLLKELLLPVAVISVKLQKLKRWEKPTETALFLTLTLGIIYKNWLQFVFPFLILLGAVTMFALRGLKKARHLGEDFGKVTIKEQPPSNTIQKIIALKEALAEMERRLQGVNISLLKIRTIALSGDLQATNKAILVLVGIALILLLVPSRVLCTLLLLDQFTIELDFRKPMFLEFVNLLKDWWETIPAAPVVVLPFEKTESSHVLDEAENSTNSVDVVAEALRQWTNETT
ncbi:hypothetical protein O6H91_21G035200 [Diphasiastrum complanatum]|uniref:Uncharacterized protein n=2 Tax=Diphasiastrum complanatum TaxID=34168 RepID=A0ACC2AJR7_DIPCM|nr:hypothetical protein O6H91_21G035200 [Diphasiastrum complanatum]KAJ7517686.1 hypothetical protein O6H91_21G035200 [Diphasiastrum complanatum]